MSKKNNNGCPIKKTSIGGQALMEGIMMRGPQITAMAVRNTDGEIVVEKFPTETKQRKKFFRLPFIRGLFNYIDSMKLGTKCLMRSAELSGLEEAEEELQREKEAKKAKKLAQKQAKKGIDAKTAAEEKANSTVENDTPANKETFATAAINKRKIGICILLSIVTLGIYQIYWEYLLVKNTRAIKKDESSCTGEMLCLIFVPFYSLYWWFTRGKLVKDKFTEHGYSAIGNEIAYLVLGIFGLGIVSMAIMQNDFNSLLSEPNQSIQQKGSSAFMGVVMTVSMILGIALAVGLFIVLPSYIYKWTSSALPVLAPENDILQSLVKSVFEGVLRIIILVAYMALMTLMKDIRRTFMYHGAEHKTIFCYEKGLELTVENVRKQRRFHPRCGTSFLIIMVLVSIFISFFIDPLFLLTLGYVPEPIYRSLLKLLLLPIIVGIGYELLKLAGRHENWFTKIISAPGMWLQHITVFEPDDSMIECAIAAVKEVIPEDESDKW